MSSKVVVPIVAVACAAGGFFAGRASAPEAPAETLDGRPVAAAPAASAPGVGGDGAKAPAPLPGVPANVEVDALRAENTALRERIAGLEKASAQTPPGGTETAAGAAPPVAAPSAEGALVAVAKLREALATGDAKKVRAIGAGDVTPQKAHAVPELLKLLEQSDSIFGKAELARLLGQLGDKRALPALHHLMETETDGTVRTALVSALGGIPDPSSVELLTKEFGRESESPMPPSLAATSLGKIGTDEAVASLKAEVESGSNGMVRAFAVRALAERKDPKLAEFFLAQVRRADVNDRFRKQAIGAIVETGNADARWELEKIAFDAKASKGVQEAAKRAVNTLAGEKVYEVD